MYLYINGMSKEYVTKNGMTFSNHRDYVREEYKEILEGIEMMTVDEVISRLPDELDPRAKQELIRRSKTETPLMFGLSVYQFVTGSGLSLKPKNWNEYKI